MYFYLFKYFLGLLQLSNYCIKYQDSNPNSNSEDDDDDDSASEKEEEEELDFDPSDEEEMPEALDVLDSFVSNLDVASTKRKATTEDPSEVDTRARKRRLVKERTEAGAENEFRTRSSGNFSYYYFFFVINLHHLTF